MQNYKCLKLYLFFLLLSPIVLFGMESSGEKSYLDDIVRTASPENKENAQNVANILKGCLKDSRLFTPTKAKKIKDGISSLKTTPKKTKNTMAAAVAQATLNSLQRTPTKDPRKKPVQSMSPALDENTSKLNSFGDISTPAKKERIDLLNGMLPFVESPESLVAVSTDHVASPKIKRSPDGKVKSCLGGHNLNEYLDEDLQGQAFQDSRGSLTLLLGGVVLKTARFGLNEVEALRVYENSRPVTIQEGTHQFIKDTRNGAHYQVLRDLNNFFSIKSLFPIPVVELKDGQCQVGTVGNILPGKFFQEIQKIVLTEAEFGDVVKNGIPIPVSPKAPYIITNITGSFHALPQGKILRNKDGADVRMPIYAKTNAQPAGLMSEIISNKFRSKIFERKIQHAVFKKELINGVNEMQAKIKASQCRRSLFSDDEI